MNELWALLEAEHEEIWSLLHELSNCADSGSAKRLAKRLVRYQSAHEWTEEAVLWPAVRRRCADGDALVEVLLGQERQLKLALHDFDHLSPPSEEFTDCMHTVASHERTHLSYEQSRIWPRLFDKMPTDEVAELAAAWRACRPKAPMRPHPHVPTTRNAMRLGLPALSLIDRMTARRHSGPPGRVPGEASS